MKKRRADPFGSAREATRTLRVGRQPSCGDAVAESRVQLPGLGQVRVDRGLSRSAFVARLTKARNGVALSPTTIASWERGATAPAWIVPVLCALLDVKREKLTTAP